MIILNVQHRENVFHWRKFVIMLMIVQQSNERMASVKMKHHKLAVRLNIEDEMDVELFRLDFVLNHFSNLTTSTPSSSSSPSQKPSTHLTCESADLFRCKTSNFCINRTFVCEYVAFAVKIRGFHHLFLVAIWIVQIPRMKKIVLMIMVFFHYQLLKIIHVWMVIVVRNNDMNNMIMCHYVYHYKIYAMVLLNVH